MNWNVGTRVIHPIFGIGMIRAVVGSGPEARLTVDFGGGVGQKKLQAGLAKLRPADQPSQDNPSDLPAESTSPFVGRRSPLSPPSMHSEPKPNTAPSQAYWYESLSCRCTPSPAHRNLFSSSSATQTIEALKTTIAYPSFWLEIREQLHQQQTMPQAMDDVENSVFLRIDMLVRGEISLHLVVQHKEFLRKEVALMALTVLKNLQKKVLNAYRFCAEDVAIQFENPLKSSDVLSEMETAEPEANQPLDPAELPDREPKRRPVRVQPKGVILNRRKGWEDY